MHCKNLLEAQRKMKYICMQGVHVCDILSSACINERFGCFYFTQGQFSSANDLHGLLKIIIPDEKTDSILTRTLPVTPSSTAKEICKFTLFLRNYWKLLCPDILIGYTRCNIDASCGEMYPRIKPCVYLLST